MDISKFLSKAIGIYLAIISIAMLLHMHQFMENVSNLLKNNLLIFITGFFTLILGVLMVVCHNIWQLNWRIAVTLFAWLALFKGIFLLCCPQIFNSAANSLSYNLNMAYAVAGLTFFIGILMSYRGFRE